MSETWPNTYGEGYLQQFQPEPAHKINLMLYQTLYELIEIELLTSVGFQSLEAYLGPFQTCMMECFCEINSDAFIKKVLLDV